MPSILFEVFERTPQNCFSLPIMTEEHAPHLRPGDRAVVDPSERAYQYGEVFAGEYSNGPAIMQALPFTAGEIIGSDEPCIALHPLNRQNSGDSAAKRIPRGAAIYLSDGPMPISHFNKIVVGRVVA